MPRNVKIQLRRDSANNWATINPTPADGEPCYESDTRLLKIGDGTTAYSNLPYVNGFQEAAIVGIEWDRSSTSPTLKYIDLFGNETDYSTSFFDNHEVFGNIGRCVVTAGGAVTPGQNARGDGLDLSGASGNVMVRIPKIYTKSDHPTAYKYRWWISGHALDDYDFSFFPSHKMRGGVEQNNIYLGAYASTLKDNAGTLEQLSKTGEQPWTGSEINSLAFITGTAEFVIGETLTGETSGATGQVIDFHLTSGTWAGGDAAGVVYLKQVTDVFQAEVLNGSSSGITAASASGANSPISLNLGEMETYGNNIGSGWGEMNFWSFSAIKLLMFPEMGSLDSQATLGKGIVDLAAGTGFAGVENGYDSADSNIGTNGTGTGTGVNGKTPVVWRGIENPYGNVNIGVIGYNAVDAEYRIINRNGTGTLAAILTAGNYEASVAVPITMDGYISNIEYEDLLQYAFIGSETAGSSAEYIPDYQHSHNVGETNILFAGGHGAYGATAGVGQLYLRRIASFYNCNFGARLEYIPQVI